MLPLGFKELKAEADTLEVTFCVDFQKILANDKTFMSVNKCRAVEVYSR
jgi:hypothetical protein